MDQLIQLLGPFFGLLLIAWIAVMLCTPILWTVLLLRAFRDLHWIQRALWAHYDLAKRASDPSIPLPRRVPEPAGEISTSMFGR